MDRRYTSSCIYYHDHAADFEPSGQNRALNYRDVLEIYVFDTSPCMGEYDHTWGTFCNIINWEGYHVTWPYDEGWADSEHGPDYWWPKYYNKIAPCIDIHGMNQRHVIQAYNFILFMR